MRISLLIASASTLLVSCQPRHDVAVTEVQRNDIYDFTTNRSVGAAETETPVVLGTVVARIIGPHCPTVSTAILSEPNTISNFWVTLEVTDVRDGFGTELKGKTIRLPTCEFGSALIGQTLPLRLSYSPGRFHKSDYWLACTSIEISRLMSTASPFTK